MNEEEASAAPVEQVANLHLDEVTGERVSKSKLKQRQKHRGKEAKARDKAANAPPKPAVSKKIAVEDEESNLTPNVCI